MGGIASITRKWVLILAVFVIFTGCVTTGGFSSGSNEEYQKIPRTVSSYEEEGKYWGKKLWTEKRTPTTGLDQQFVRALVFRIDYFSVHSDLKEAFKKGFRMGYEDRIADLVLGPHVTAAAAFIGKDTSEKFVKVINDFEEGWARTLKHAIDVFIVLISEGSQTDRERFISQFTEVYRVKFNSTQALLKAGAVVTQVSEGGTMLFIDYSKGKALGALDIPSPERLKTEIYHQTFKVMGDELGRRFSTNLIKREELIDLLRRSKTAFQEVPPSLERNIGILEDAFVKSYGTDGFNVFRGVLKDAGYTITPIPTTVEPGAAPAPAQKKAPARKR